MTIRVNDIFEAEGKDYAVLDKITHKGIVYIFTNELDGEEPTAAFRVYKVVENGIVEITDRRILSEVLPIFSSHMNDRLEIINECFAQMMG